MLIPRTGRHSACPRMERRLHGRFLPRSFSVSKQLRYLSFCFPALDAVVLCCGQGLLATACTPYVLYPILPKTVVSTCTLITAHSTKQYRRERSRERERESYNSQCWCLTSSRRLRRSRKFPCILCIFLFLLNEQEWFNDQAAFCFNWATLACFAWFCT